MIDYVSFRTLYRQCLRGIGYTLGEPKEGEFFERVADAMSDALSRLWRSVRCPQLMLWEKRVYRRPWGPEVAWLRGHECYFGGKYFEALVDGPTEVPGESEQWRQVPDGELVKFVALDQPWEAHEMALNGIDLGHFAFDGDPRLGKAKAIAGCKWSGDYPGGGTTRVLLPENAPNEVVVCFLPKAPRVEGTLYDGSATYGYGDVVYDEASGECYRCVAKRAGTPLSGRDWEMVRIPRFLVAAIKVYVKGEFMEEEQGRSHMRKRFEEEVERLREELIGATGAFDEATVDLGE